jgi:hypothetical protein
MKPQTKAEIDFCTLVARTAAARGITLERAAHLFGVMCKAMVTHDVNKLGHEPGVAALKYIDAFMDGMGATPAPDDEQLH